MTNAPDATVRADTGQSGVGIATGQEQLYAQGFPKGAIMQRFGSAASVVRDLPGWFIADGTQPPLVIDGVSYGSPNFNKMTIMGADGSAGFTPGATGGAASAGAHTHSFTQPDNHAHSANHTVGQPTTHAITQPVITAHGFNTAEVLQTPGTGVWIGWQNSAANVTAAFGHALGTNVGLDHNHDGVTVAAHDAHTHANGAVGAVSGASTAYPPYVAIWILIKVFD